jgi:hypothetical protein
MNHGHLYPYILAVLVGLGIDDVTFTELKVPAAIAFSEAGVIGFVECS